MKINGIIIAEPIPSCVGSFGGKLLILGGAKCIWDDYSKAKELLSKDYEIMCVNDIGGQFKAERIEHAVSLHKGNLPAVRLMRKEKSLLGHVHTHGYVAGDEVDVIWPIEERSGTSGLFAVKIAILLGYRKIILCGLPIDDSGHYFDPPDASLNKTAKFSGSSYIRTWTSFRDESKEAKERVRSMSGKSKSVFGEPTIEWLG